MEKLFVIGNGFDLAHDLKTSYLNFKRFVYQQSYNSQVDVELDKMSEKSLFSFLILYNSILVTD